MVNISTEKIKVIVSGNQVEIIEYLFPDTKKKRSSQKNILSFDEKVENRKKTLFRTRSSLRRLICCNPDLFRFVTLTFKENVTDLNVANKHFKRFIQRVNYKHKNFKYIAVVEFQKRGAVHYHLLIDRFIKKEDLSSLWGHSLGMTNIKMLRDRKYNERQTTDYIASYLGKYLTKQQASDTRLWKKKSYFISKGLNKPFERVYDDLVDAVNTVRMLKRGCKQVKRISRVVSTDFLGDIFYTRIYYEKIPLKPKKVFIKKKERRVFTSSL
jgi:hypothetical protein